MNSGNILLQIYLTARTTFLHFLQKLLEGRRSRERSKFSVSFFYSNSSSPTTLENHLGAKTISLLFPASSARDSHPRPKTLSRDSIIAPLRRDGAGIIRRFVQLQRAFRGVARIQRGETTTRYGGGNESGNVVCERRRCFSFERYIPPRKGGGSRVRRVWVRLAERDSEANKRENKGKTSPNGEAEK